MAVIVTSFPIVVAALCIEPAAVSVGRWAYGQHRQGDKEALHFVAPSHH